MTASPHHSAAPPGADIQTLQDLLDKLPAPLEPLDPMAVDGFLCGVILQPQELPPARWLPFVADIDGRAPPPGITLADLHTEVLHRHAELVHAIDARQWFDPWVFELDEEATPSLTVLPWVAGFAAAMDQFPALMASDDPALIEPLALLYRHFDPEDLEDADALLEVIETLEPPADLAEAVEDLVRSVLLIADVTRPRRSARRPAGGTRPRRAR
jgi:uncharacterized protein